jgi:SepF-like predicted cell division protein (DUF552 family)
MYDRDGNLKPIEINTSVGWHYNKLENNEEALDLSELSAFISARSFNKVVYIGNISYLNTTLETFTAGLSLEYEYFKVTEGSLTVPFVEDNETTLIIRSAYDTTAIVDDTYCRDKVEFLKLIKDQTFGSQFAYLDDNGDLINYITSIADNGEHPNFILKARYPNYDRSQYPKLFKVATQEELNVVINTLTQDYFLMEFFFNPSTLVGDHLQLKRGLSLLYPPTLESIPLGGYATFCTDVVTVEKQYDTETFELTSPNNAYITTDFTHKTPKLERTDLVVMADGTTKLAVDLEVGDLIKTIDIPNPFNVNNYEETVNYKITVDELEAGTTYSTNKILKKATMDTWCPITTLNFTDGSDWLDTEGSKYLAVKNNEVRFLSIRPNSPEENTLAIGDTVLLLDTSNLETPTFVEKVVASIETTSQFFGGYIIEVEREHLFLTRASLEDTISYVAIEHNAVPCYDGYYSGCNYSIFCSKGIPFCCGATYTCRSSCAGCPQP